MVLLGELEGVRVLLLSDLGKPGQNALMQRHPDLRADIVLSGVPARTEPLAEALLDGIQPGLILITDSEYPATRRASRPLRERLAARNVPVLYTRETGCVTLTGRQGAWEARTTSGLRIRGQRSEVRDQKSEVRGQKSEVRGRNSWSVDASRSSGHPAVSSDL